MATRAARPMRADARRNYARLLAAADAVFTEHGTDASLDDVARRAEVGIGTLYRHFPTREALLNTVLLERNAELCRYADVLIDTAEPRDALHAWARAIVLHGNTYRGLAQALLTSQFTDSELKDACTRMDAAAERLVGHARNARVVRADVSGADLVALINAIALASGRAPDPMAQADRLLDLAMNGLIT